MKTNIKYVTVFSLCMTSFGIMVALTTGFQANGQFSQFVASIPIQAAAVSRDANFQLIQIPSVLQTTLSNFSTNLNNTIDSEVARLNTPTAQLVVPVTQLQTQLLEFQQLTKWLNDTLPALDANLTLLYNQLQNLQSSLQNSTTQLTALNGIFGSGIQGSKITFQLKTKQSIPPAALGVQFTTALTNLGPMVSNPQLGVRVSGFLASFPNLTQIQQQLSTVLNQSSSGGIQDLISAPVKQLVAEKVGNSSAVAVSTVQTFVGNLSASVLQANTTFSDSFDSYGVARWDYIRGILVSLVLSCAALAAFVVIVSVVARWVGGIKMILPQLAFVSFLALVLGAVLFAAAVAVGQEIQNFMVARQTCLNRTAAGGLLDFAVTMGVDPNLVNFTIRANPIIQRLDLSTDLKLNLTQIMGNSNPSQLISPQINNTLFQMLSQGNATLSQLGQFTGSNITNGLSLAQSQIAGLQASLQFLMQTQQTNPAALVNLFTVVSNPNNEVLTVSMLSGFLSNAGIALGGVQGMSVNLNTVNSVVTGLSGVDAEFVNQWKEGGGITSLRLKANAQPIERQYFSRKREKA
ncbi:hypothetical protein HDU98_000246 [Podochytrium sp. JEL0797]|nr:hypothetical protein HDU98_000246 [Podochytrium sp. JEL0797]